MRVAIAWIAGVGVVAGAAAGGTFLMRSSASMSTGSEAPDPAASLPAEPPTPARQASNGIAAANAALSDAPSTEAPDRANKPSLPSDRPAVATMPAEPAVDGIGRDIQVSAVDAGDRPPASAPPAAAPRPSEPAIDGTVASTGQALRRPSEGTPGQADGTADATPEPTQEAPDFDIVRIDPQGSALVAGQSRPNATVTVRLDGAPVASAKSDAAGNFVSFFSVPQVEAPRVLTLEEDAADGGDPVRSASRVIVAPAVPAAAAPSTESAPAPGGLDTAAAGGIEPVPPGDDSSDAPPPTARADAPPFPDRVADMAVAAVPPPEPGPTTSIPADRPGTGTARPAAPRVTVATVDVPSRIPTPPTSAAARTSPPVAPRLIRSGPEGIEVLGPGPAPAVRSDLQIAAISYDDFGDVRLAGRGREGADLRIYLDNRPVLSVRIGADGAWSSPLPDVDTGVYTLRIDALDEDGSVAERIETPFERTAPALARAAREAGVTAITVQPGFTLWAISEGYFGDGFEYVQIFEANRDLIRDPDLIYPGQVFALPEPPVDEG